jgi:hypothetical protein
MTENEKQLLKLIRENDNPEQALTVAVNTILSFLEQHESYPKPSVACLQGQA